MKYLKRFEKMCDDIAKSPFFEIVAFEVRPPVSLHAVRQAEKVIQAPLSESIRDFYREMDGFYLRWRFKLDLPLEVEERIRRTCDDYPITIAEPESEAFARIDIAPLSQVFARTDWENVDVGDLDSTVQMKGRRVLMRELMDRIYPFDRVNSYWCMAFMFEPGSGDPDVLLLSDGWSEWDNSRLTRFDSYLEFLLATRGIVEAREEVFAERHGDRKPPLEGGQKLWEKKTPKLFRKVVK